MNPYADTTGASGAMVDGVVGLTDALLEATRVPIPDLAAIALLVQLRDELLGLALPTVSDERLQRLKLLQWVQSADAVIRSRLDERRARVGEELRLLHRRPRRPRARANRPDLLDRRV